MVKASDPQSLDLGLGLDLKVSLALQVSLGSLAHSSPKVSCKSVSQLCLTLCDPMNYTVHGILQARILEWVAFPFSRGSSQPRDQTQGSNSGLPHCRQILYQLSHKGRPFDCADHNKLWKILKEMGIPDHLTCLLRNTYM